MLAIDPPESKMKATTFLTDNFEKKLPMRITATNKWEYDIT
jgi:hypothetical protein